jgi:uncharacterized phage infection (PIP) family protein YhgE
MKYLNLFLIVLLIGLMASGCSKSAKEKYCDDRDDVRSSVDDLTNSLTTLDVNKIEDSANKVRTNIDDLEQAAQKVNGPPINDLSSAYDQLAAAIRQVAQGGGNLTSNLQTLQTSLSQFSTTLNSFIQAYSCN